MKIFLRYSLLFILLLAFGNARSSTAASSAVLSSDATLKSIVLSTATTLVFTTGPSDYNYTTSVSPGTASLKITPTTNDASAKVTVNGVAVASGTQSASITLNGIVTTTINMVVTAQDGVTTHSYSIVVYETGSNDAYLSSLSVSTGNALVSSSTGPGTFNYTTSVTVGTSSLTVTPITSDPTATVQVNGVAVTSGSASGPISLNPAANATTTITVTVLAQDGVTTQTYAIMVTEAGSNNALLSVLQVKTNAGASTALTSTSGTSNFNYTTSVKSSTTYVIVNATSADGTATVNINGTNVASGTYSGSITVPTGGVVIPVTVTAQDGVTQETYSIQVLPNATSGATLSSLTISANGSLISTSGSCNINYTTDLDPSVSSITVTPTANSSSAGASITVNGTAVTSGSASGSIALNAVGTPTTITTSVTSQDGLTTHCYSITVNRNGSNNANAAIALSTNTSLVLVSQSSSAISYKTSVPASTTSITVTPTASDPNYSSITVNGTVVASGQTSAPIALSSPATATITVVVTAQDGTTLTTTISVLTTGSNNANLSSISLTPNPTSTYSLVLTSQTTNNINYSTSLNSSCTSVTVTPTASDANATITITANGTTVPISSGSASSAIALAAVGSTTVVTLTVKSPDGTVTKTTNITISRSGSNNANSSFILSTNTTTTSTTGQYNSNYTTAVSPHTSSLTVTVTASDPNSTITVNGLASVSGSPSYPITLSNGSTSVVIQVTAPDGVTTKSTGIVVTRTGALYAWTGASSTAYNNSANWNPTKVPTSSDVATFGETAYAGNQPTINGAVSVGEIYFGSATPTTLTVTSGSSSSFNLTVGTNITVDAGAIATIKSSSTSPAYVNIAAGANVNFGGTGSQLIISSPVVFTLLSTAASSASIGQMTTSSIVGTVSVQRYISGGSNAYRGYRMLSSPVYQGTANGNNIYSINYVQSSSLVTGTSATGGFNKVGNPSLYLFREDVPSNNYSFTGGNYWGISAINNSPNYNYYMNNGTTVYNIPVANGFLFFFRGDNINNLSSKYSSTTSAESVTMTMTGTLNAGQITVHDWFTPASANLSYTSMPSNGGVQGLNLVGNPYASSIDWDTYNTTNSSTGIYASNVGTSIYILDPVSKNYGVYIANSAFGGTNNATHIIPSGQGFFVQASGVGASLTFNEDAKTTTQVVGSNLLMGTPVASAVSQYLHLKLNKDSQQADEIFISFKDNAQSKYVFGEDAVQKPGFGAASLASLSNDGVPLSINTLSLTGKKEAISLNVDATVGGSYQLTVPEIKSIPAAYGIWLVDAYKKDSVDVRQTPTYNFTIDKSDAASYGSGRFSLVIGQNSAMSLRLLDFAATKVTNGAQIVWKTVNEQNYTNFTVERSTDNGKTFEQLGGFLSTAGGTYSYVDKNPLVAVDKYRLKMEDLNGAISYSKIVPLEYSTLSDNISKNAINVYPNPTSGMVNLAINQNSGSISGTGLSALQTLSSAPVLVNGQNSSSRSYDIKVINITGNVVKTATSSQPSWQENLSNLLPGTYIIQVLNSSDKSLVGKSTFVKL